MKPHPPVAYENTVRSNGPCGSNRPSPCRPFIVPEPLSLHFEGFSEDAFAVLERLRAHPHIEQYRAEKDAITHFVTDPFKRYRDDLALGWVLPNGLPFETEKNVFSRLLKNDFGAGGCHHHQWMAFYRPPRRRLTDVQLSHSLYPDGFAFGLYVGEYAKGLFPHVKAQMQEEPERALAPRQRPHRAGVHVHVRPDGDESAGVAELRRAARCPPGRPRSGEGDVGSPYAAARRRARCRAGPRTLRPRRPGRAVAALRVVDGRGGQGLAYASSSTNPPTPMPDLVLRHRDGAALTLTLNRPDKRNALGADLVTALREALADGATDDSVRVVVLTGAGKVFSAGADLAALEALQTASPMENLADSRHLAGLFEAIYRHPKPVIAKVNGHAIAGGCGLAAVCDFALVADHARLGFTEVRIGFVPAIVSVFVLRKLGEAAARDLFLRGGLVSAAESAALGLVTRAVPADDLDAATDALARELATETSATALALTKQLLADVPGMGLSEALDHAVQLNALARGTDDCKAGITAFLGKTDPPWRASKG